MTSIPTTMRHTTLVLSLLAIAACVPSAHREARLSRIDETFEFNERAPGSDQVLRGTVRVLGDSAIVDSEDGLCRYEFGASAGSKPMTYNCGDVTYLVDRYSPELRVTYVFFKTETRKRSVCVSYVTDPNGKQVCTQTAVELVERKVPVRGQLHTRAAEL